MAPLILFVIRPTGLLLISIGYNPAWNKVYRGFGGREASLDEQPYPPLRLGRPLARYGD